MTEIVVDSVEQLNLRIQKTQNNEASWHFESPIESSWYTALSMLCDGHPIYWTLRQSFTPLNTIHIVLEQ